MVALCCVPSLRCVQYIVIQLLLTCIWVVKTETCVIVDLLQAKESFISWINIAEKVTGKKVNANIC